jgi:hypothetical protein
MLNPRLFSGASVTTSSPWTAMLFIEFKKWTPGQDGPRVKPGVTKTLALGDKNTCFGSQKHILGVTKTHDWGDKNISSG